MVEERAEERADTESSKTNSRKSPVGAGRPSQRRTVGQTTPCKECGATEWHEDEARGETYCVPCGNVAEENAIDPGAEWTNYSDGADRSRVGAPTRESLSDKGLNHQFLEVTSPAQAPDVTESRVATPSIGDVER